MPSKKRDLLQEALTEATSGRDPEPPAQSADTKKTSKRPTGRPKGRKSLVSKEKVEETELFEVLTPTKARLGLLSKEESEWYDSQHKQYEETFSFTNASDIQDLDRLLLLEVMIHRWSIWLGRGFSYTGHAVDEKEIRMSIGDYSLEIRRLKAALGVERVSREANIQGETTGEYLSHLLQRAKEFGVHRNQQYDFAVTNMWELINRIQTYDRCDDQERTEIGLSPESIIGWIREEVIPKWEEVNESFRENQKIWVKRI